MLEQTQSPSSSTLSLERLLVDAEEGVGRSRCVTSAPSPLPAIFRAGNFLSLLWFSYLG